MKLLKLIRKNLARRPMRTLLTTGGVASAMLLLLLVESMSAGLDAALSGAEAARTLIVYQQNRYCPQTSNMPERYAKQIAEVDGVQSVLPLKVYLNNCRASLDLVAFQGAPVEQLLESRRLEVTSGSAEQFKEQRDSALVGRTFATRKGIEVGEQFRFGNINVKVAGIFKSDEPIEEGVILTHLDFLQRAGPVNSIGNVTQFEVKIRDASRAREIARSIDDIFRTAEKPTDTRPKILFLEGATRDLREILRFARILGIACVVVMLTLVGNTVLMSVQERIREFGVLRTLGFREGHVALIVLGEAFALALVGGLIGLGIAFAIIRISDLTIGSEGVPISFTFSPALALKGIGIMLLTGALSSLFPAIRSARSEIVGSLRSAG
jgi:putative ABC transport system permease protein